MNAVSSAIFPSLHEQMEKDPGKRKWSWSEYREADDLQSGTGRGLTTGGLH